MPLPFPWPKSVKVAYEFTISGVERGMTQTAALAAYRAGGGKIRTAYWGAAWRSAYALYAKAERIKDIPVTYTVPETMFEESGFDWREKYVMQMRCRVSDPKTGKRYWRDVTVESKTMITRSEWNFGAQQAIDLTEGSDPAKIEYVSEYHGFIRIEKEEE